jgi:hypothetical protein
MLSPKQVFHPSVNSKKSQIISLSHHSSPFLSIATKRPIKFLSLFIRSADWPAKTKIMASNWIRPADISEVPVGAVLAGCDADGDDVFVGRVRQDGNVVAWSIVSIIPNKGVAHGLRDDGTPFERFEAEVI